MRTGSTALVLALCLVGTAPGAWGADAQPPPGPLWPTAGATRGPKALQSVAPGAEAKAVLEAIRGYQKWPHFAENVQPKRSLAHHGLWVLVFHNEVVTAAVAKHQLPLPDGSLLVKENRFTADGEVVLLTVMSKQHGRWYWLEVTPQGQVVQAAGAKVAGFGVKACAGCHEQNVDNDAVFTHPFSEE
jgi:hypothetical protein